MTSAFCFLHQLKIVFLLRELLMPLTFREINLPVTMCKNHEENKGKTIYITREGEGLARINQMGSKMQFPLYLYL